jgi:hypothetical protein
MLNFVLYSLLCNVSFIIFCFFVFAFFVIVYVCTLFGLLFYVHVGGMSHSVLWYLGRFPIRRDFKFYSFTVYYKIQEINGVVLFFYQ